MKRRNFLGSLGAVPALAQAETKKKEPPKTKPMPMDLSQYQPKSMLDVPVTKIETPKFPVIDVHTHLTWSKADTTTVIAGPEKLLPVMDRRNIKLLVNLTGGYGKGLQAAIETFDKAHPGRFATYTEPAWDRASQPGYSKWQADELEKAKQAGARGLKVLKTLGLFLKENGKLVKVDDPRFDPMWEAAGALGLPVSIHVSDPVAFFLPIDRHNERFEELNNHPDWSFHGNFPSNAEILEARDRVIARHPKTTFNVLHVGNFAENLEHVSRSMDRYPNMCVELAARVGELGRQPRTSRKFFEKYQDRIMFGTDAVYDGWETPQQVFCDDLYKIYYRYLETEDEYFDYAPAPTPPQGRWQIYGIGLPEEILRKVYNENATRLLGL